MAAPLQLEAGAEAGQTRPEDHHAHGACGLRDGAQVVEGASPNVTPVATPRRRRN